MDARTCAALAALNREFYSAFAAEFDRTRAGWPPGFARILPHLQPAANVLDLGCGNGRLLSFLRSRHWQGNYCGVDGSAALLAAARRSAGAWIDAAATGVFLEADLLGPDWTADLGGFRPDAIVSLAVLHHVPRRANRVHFLAECARLIRPRGTAILSAWQFMSSARLRTRVLSWEVAGLQPNDVEPNDYLVAWGAGAAGKRYCAFIDRDELVALGSEAGLVAVEIFFADGHEGNLNLYGVFAAAD